MLAGSHTQTYTVNFYGAVPLLLLLLQLSLVQLLLLLPLLLVQAVHAHCIQSLAIELAPHAPTATCKATRSYNPLAQIRTGCFCFCDLYSYCFRHLICTRMWPECSIRYVGTHYGKPG